MKIIVLNSGGFDSTALLHWVRENHPNDEIYSLFFNYGQNNLFGEAVCAMANANKLLCKEHKLVKLPPIDWTSNKFYDSDSTVDNQYLEMRNLIFLSYALSYAQSIGATAVFSAFISPQLYDDTTQKFVRKVNGVYKIANVTLIAPFIKMYKDSLWKYVQKRGYDISESDVFSCNTPVAGKPCGKCNDCESLGRYFKS